MNRQELESLRNQAVHLDKAEVARRIVEMSYSPPISGTKPKDNPDFAVSPIITGLHDRKRKQQHTFTGNTSGQGLTYQPLSSEA